MLYVVLEELPPEMSVWEHSNTGIVTFAVGVSLRMVLGWVIDTPALMLLHLYIFE